MRLRAMTPPRINRKRVTVRPTQSLPEGLEIHCFLGDSPEEFRAALDRALADHLKNCDVVPSDHPASEAEMLFRAG